MLSGTCGPQGCQVGKSMIEKAHQLLLLFRLLALANQMNHHVSEYFKILSFSSLVYLFSLFRNFPSGSDGKASACNAGGLGSIPGSGRSPGEGNGTPLQYSCLGNPMDGGVS